MTEGGLNAVFTFFQSVDAIWRPYAAQTTCTHTYRTAIPTKTKGIQSITFDSKSKHLTYTFVLYFSNEFSSFFLRFRKGQAFWQVHHRQVVFAVYLNSRCCNSSTCKFADGVTPFPTSFQRFRMYKFVFICIFFSVDDFKKSYVYFGKKVRQIF